MVQTISKPATYEDLKAVPEHLVAEILFGELVTHPRPALRHSGVASALGVILGGPFQFGKDGPGGWIFLVEPELHLGEHVAVPDLAGWRRERMPEVPDRPWHDLAPDWICEILSPSTELYDKGDKRAIYAQAGVNHLWLVDPRPRLLEAFELRNGEWVLLKTLVADDHVAVAPFDAAPFSLDLLWPFGQPASANTETNEPPSKI